MSLSKIVEEIKTIKPFAEENVESGPYETMNARRGRKNQSIERLKQLKRQYRIELLESAAFIVVTGEKRDAFTSIATEGFKCFFANPNEFYEDLASRIPEVLYKGRATPTDLFDILGRHLYDKTMELDISEYNQLVFRQGYRAVIESRDDLVSLIRTAINEQMGSEIVGIQAATSLVSTAVEQGHKSLVTPIILSTDNEKLALDLAGSLRKLHALGVFTVVAGKGTKALRALPGVISVKDPTAENVEKALTDISNVTKK
jgi:hypothetical protein